MPTVHQKVSVNTTAGSFIAIHLEKSASSSVASYGYICNDDTPPTNNTQEALHINSARIVKVVKITIPGYPLEYYNEGLTLGDFHDIPFNVYIKYKYLFTASERVHNLVSDTSNIPIIPMPSINSDITSLPINTNNNSVDSRVLKDGFHIMDMIKVNKSHGMQKDFMRRFRDIMCVCDQDDKALVESYLKSIGTDWKTRMLINPAWIFERVRRPIRLAEELYPALKFLFECYGPLRCEHSGLKLFNDAAFSMSLHVLDWMWQGHVSEVVNGPPLYTEKGLDKNNLMTYKCSRGTSSVEGACHMSIVRKFASYGKTRQGHYIPWLVLAINLLRTEVGHDTVMNYTCERYGSYLNFKQTNETFGVVDIPRTFGNSIGIKPTESLAPKKVNVTKGRMTELASLPVIELPKIIYSSNKFKYKYLSNCQGTLNAVTAVHTKEEVCLFEILINTQGQESTSICQPFDSEKPNFELFYSTSNSKHCQHDTNIYYKTPGHLKSYFNILEDRKKYGNTVLKNIEISQTVRVLAESPSRFIKAIPALPKPIPPIEQHFPLGTVNPPSLQLQMIRPAYRSRHTRCHGRRQEQDTETTWRHEGAIG
ncbi:hypothetical protein INT47_009299 [Mucor saturninus]|uniref:Uncharacterized protein n=1 Tax=Mucor saturninus TaxID=64648 RepID=A0A8H7QGI3_9FUNG|nr:hypothetical protein INT47_009299 [Mucor saturninus]